MHELAIAQELSYIVLRTADKEKLSAVSGVNVIFGRMIQVVPEIFEFAFRESVRDTIARDAKLQIDIIPVRVKCSECGGETDVDEMFIKCNYCHSRNVVLIQGKEIYIKSIEGE
ncbi:MAG TPA: hydrogenase maturation nickel metallochaperone HypA [Bacteroidales bacterium]|nr:hydrogenase maturation nickel metallochaperone HypA [Bacteroidales bacterium]